jgi:hypothetical protein
MSKGRLEAFSDGVLYATELINQRWELAQVITEIRVIDRGTWGELRFSLMRNASSKNEELPTGEHPSRENPLKNVG